MNTALSRTISSILTNKSGGNVVRGDVVIVDTANAGAFTTTTTASLATSVIGVVIEPGGILDDAQGMVAFGGYVSVVNLDAAAAIGDGIKTSTVEKQATPYANFDIGNFGVVLAASATPDAILFGGIPQQSVVSQPYAQLRDEKAIGTDGGTSAADGYQTRDLNTEVVDVDNIVTLAANRFTPIAGVYYIRSSAPSHCDRSQSNLNNFTTATTILYGTSEYCTTASSSRSEVSGIFTANGTDEYEIRHYTETEVADSGLGVATNNGVDVEVYTIVELWKKI